MQIDISAMYNPAMPATGNYPIQTDVRMKRLAFYDILATLLQPYTLIPSTSQRMQENSYTFHLSPGQATEIAMNRDIRSIAKQEHAVQVQMRFCLLETSCEQDDYFPPNVSVKVNGKLCPLPVRTRGHPLIIIIILTVHSVL